MKNITDLQEKTLDFVVKSGLTEGFYLAGGTAIIIKYAHRYSEDFDFFSLEIPESFERKVERIMETAQKEGWKVEYEKKSPDTVIFRLNSVKFSFFEYPYRLIRPFDKRFFPLLLASDEDIVAMKSIAIIQRGTKKDFYDFYFLLKKNKWDFNDVIRICYEKYGNNFITPLFLKAVVYFEEAEVERSYPEVEKEWQNVKNYLTKVSKDFIFRNNQKPNSSEDSSLDFKP
ncbi:nucleotidyl transferase AbiEii/AbiGii toxin family protein [Desulfurobacterium sp.]|uniref:nucleotidyl transferase AbiEii/AbiGii toxin family protein n=1 Tax=Desulfurobacterium sp. TaxID=2004706 RepID=UPI0026019D64|nr:nucleotidyl transferase AbiEii/AbiGii toxin family protein [Desulfurobacterium sp.]